MRSDVPKAPAATGEDRAKLIEHLVDSSEHKFEVELDWPTSGLSTARDAEVVKSFSQVTYGSLSQALAKESGATWVDRALQSGGVKLSAGGGGGSTVLFPHSTVLADLFIFWSVNLVIWLGCFLMEFRIDLKSFLCPMIGLSFGVEPDGHSLERRLSTRFL